MAALAATGRYRASSAWNVSQFSTRPHRGWGSLRAPSARTAWRRYSTGASIGMACSGARESWGWVLPLVEAVVASPKQRGKLGRRWRAPMAVALRRGGVVFGPGESAPGTKLAAKKYGVIEKGILGGDILAAKASATSPHDSATPGTSGVSRSGWGREWSFQRVLKAVGMEGPERMEPQAMRSKLVQSKPSRRSDGGYQVLLAERRDLEEASALCIKVFFGKSDSPWRAFQLRKLLEEQRWDLETRFISNNSVMFKAVDNRVGNKGAMVGFIEVSRSSGWKYGMGGGVPLADTRPVVSNLAVDPRVRRCGIGSALMDACEDVVKKWRFDEIILQVEEDNIDAFKFYERLGFHALFVDRGARRYDTSGFLLRNVRTTKLTMRKALESDATGSGESVRQEHVVDQIEVLSLLLDVLVKPFGAARLLLPPPLRVPAPSRRRRREDTRVWGETRGRRRAREVV